MFDISILAKTWAKAVAAQGPVVQEEIFKSKLSKLGVKAPLGTPPAHEQLAKAIAKSYIINGGSGNFMGQEVNDHGVNKNMIKAELIVGSNMPYQKASFIADKAGSIYV